MLKLAGSVLLLCASLSITSATTVEKEVVACCIRAEVMFDDGPLYVSACGSTCAEAGAIADEIIAIVRG